MTLTDSNRKDGEVTMVPDTVNAHHRSVQKSPQLEPQNCEVELQPSSPQCSTDLEAQHEHQLTKSETIKSARPYSIFNTKQKRYLIIVVSIGAAFSPFTTNIYFPLINVISSALGVSVTDVNLSITSYMIVQACAPSFISAIADDYGRRLAYVVGFIFYLAANLGLGLNNSYAGLIALRCLQSAGSSGMVTLSQGTVADLITSAERGRYISITSMPAILAPSVAPILGGVIGGHWGWHSVFWFLLILGGIYFVPLALFFPETNRKLVGDGSVTPPKWSRTLPDVLSDRKCQITNPDDLDAARVLQPRTKKMFNPLATLALLAEPSTAIILFVTGISYSSFYAVSTSLTVQFHEIYNLNTTLQGLLFLPQAIGTVFATIINTRLVDANFARHASRAHVAVDKKRQLDILATPMHIERARLDIGIPMIAASGIFTIVYGWLVQAQVNIWAPIVLLVLMGFTMLSGFSVINVLNIDLHRDRPATASAANNLVRCLMGAGSAAVVDVIIDAVGVGWCFTIWGLLVTGLSVPLLLAVCRWGPAWRARRVEVREEKKLREKTEHVEQS